MASIVSYDDSILESITKLLTGEENGDYFDPDICMGINTALASLVQVGVGPNDGFCITGHDETWADFLGDDKRLSMAINYVHLKVKMIWDPPSSSTIKEAMTEQLHELEWRCCIAADPASYPLDEVSGDSP